MVRRLSVGLLFASAGTAKTGKGSAVAPSDSPARSSTERRSTAFPRIPQAPREMAAEPARGRPALPSEDQYTCGIKKIPYPAATLNESSHSPIPSHARADIVICGGRGVRAKFFRNRGGEASMRGLVVTCLALCLVAGT